MKNNIPLHLGFVSIALLTLAAPAFAWGAHGHRTITYLALDALPDDAPAWLTSDPVWSAAAYQANEPDRWRGVPSLYLAHENAPDHYIDFDLLPNFGLSAKTLPKPRAEYLRAMVISKEKHPEMAPLYNPEKDAARNKEWPGFLPYSIVEHYGKLQSSFNTIRMLESLSDPARAHQLEAARANAAFHMGQLSHFVGDGAQPLHTTKHHHGWIGDNPHNYTTDYRFHAYIDTDVVDLHALTFDELRDRIEPLPIVNAQDPWDDVLAYLHESFELVEPLYKLEKSMEINGRAGEEFIAQRLARASEMLGALYWAAWTSSEPSPDQIQNFVKYNAFKPEILPPAPNGPPTNNATKPVKFRPRSLRPALPKSNNE